MFLVRNGGGLDSGDAVALIAGGGLVHRVQVASGDRVRGGERGKPMVGWGGLGPVRVGSLRCLRVFPGWNLSGVES